MQVVTTSPGNEGSNNSGVGAVIFDSTTDPGKLHEENLKMWDDGLQRRKVANAQKAALGYKLVGDLNPDVKGIMDSDAEYFRNRAAELSRYQSKMFGAGLNPENPAFGDAYTKGNYAKNALDIDVQASVNQKQVALNAAAEYAAHPEKYEDISLKNLAAYRAQPYEVRKNYDVNKLLIPKKASLSDIIGAEVKKLELKPGNVPDEKGRPFSVQTVNGNDIMVQQTETLPLRKAADANNSLYNNSPEYKEKLNEVWGTIEGTTNEGYYQKLAEQYKKDGLPVYSAKDAYATQQWRLFNQQDQVYTSLGNNIYAVGALKDKEEAKQAEGIYQNAVKAFAGDPKIITPGYYESERTDANNGHLYTVVDGKRVMSAAGKNKINVTKIPQYEGTQMGEYSTVDANGNPTTEKNIIQGAYRLKDGRVAVTTTKTQDLYAKGSLPYPYTVYSTPIEFAIAQVQAAPADEKDAGKKDKILSHLYEVEKTYNKKYGNNYEAQAGLKPEDVQQRNAILETPWNAEVKTIQPTVSKTSTPQNDAGSSYTIKGKKYTQEQILKAAKASDMTVEEYVNNAMK